MARVGRWGVVTLAIFMALQELGVATDIVTTAFAILFGALALGMALAFGLGNRELAGEITREWYVRYRAEREAIEREVAEREQEAEAEMAEEDQARDKQGQKGRDKVGDKPRDDRERRGKMRLVLGRRTHERPRIPDPPGSFGSGIGETGPVADLAETNGIGGAGAPAVRPDHCAPGTGARGGAGTGNV